MKLITKLLTTLTPVAIVGAITPSIVSCGCSGKEYKIEYGDSINCKDKKEKKTYKKIDKVQTAITNKIQVETIEEKQISVTDLNSKIKTDVAVFQNVYYELVYHYAFTTKGFTLTDWQGIQTSEPTWEFKINDQPYDVIFTYYNNSGKVWLKAGTNLDFVSHTYEHCIATN